MAVAHDGGQPVVIANAPLLDDGRPMPTRYWLVDVDLRRRVSQLEGDGGVRAAEASVDAEALAAAHGRYAAERDALVPVAHSGPRPSGGVGGTARGVKCLHAHLAYRLAGGDDPVGDWVLAQLGAIGEPPAVAGASGFEAEPNGEAVARAARERSEQERETMGAEAGRPANPRTLFEATRIGEGSLGPVAELTGSASKRAGQEPIRRRGRRSTPAGQRLSGGRAPAPTPTEPVDLGLGESFVAGGSDGS